MVKIHAAPNDAQVYNLANVLENHGIACQIRGEDRRAGLGELPPHECWPELWIVDETRADEARKIISEAETVVQPPWTCPGCGEKLGGQFDVCWQCGAERPASSGSYYPETS